MALIEEINDLYTIAVVCNQWGDTGKGKFVDLFASVWADIIARGTGGANAGHTMKVLEESLIMHLIPSGILHDRDGKVNVLGNGMALDPRIILEELAELDKRGVSYDNLMIARNGKLVLPQHLVMDRCKESELGETKIGTTGRGIGPVYTDHAQRIGLEFNDMLNKDVFSRNLKKNLADKVKLLRFMDPDKVKEVMHHEHLLNGRFYDPKNFFDVDAIVETYTGYGKELRHMITDTDKFIQQSLGKKRILFEGAQGLLLGNDYGSVPFVTSSDPTIRGLAKGVGLNDDDVDLVLGIVKAYMTRVGEGPFPTEYGGAESARWCDKHNRFNERDEYNNPSINSGDEFERGVAIRYKGDEFGATTNRSRRTGRLDLPLLRHAMTINRENIIISKFDVLDECENIEICDHYVYTGPEYNLGNKVLKDGERIDVANMKTEILSSCRPVYEVLEGWMTDTTCIRDRADLPLNARKTLDYIVKRTGAEIRIVGVGPERSQNIFM